MIASGSRKFHCPWFTGDGRQTSDCFVYGLPRSCKHQSFDFIGEHIDVLLDLKQPAMHQMQRRSKVVRNPVLSILEDLGNVTMKVSEALPNRDAKLQQQTSDVVRDGGPVPDQHLPRALNRL